MLRTCSHSSMGSMQVVMTFSHNLCKFQCHASDCSSVTSFPALSVYYQFNSPKLPLTLSFAIAFSYSITVTTQGLNRRLVQHKAKLSCCSNTLHLRQQTFELKMDLAIPWSYCLAIFILQILVDLVDLVDILVDFLRHLVLHFLLNKGTGRQITQ